MSKRCLRRQGDSLELLERILTRTTLSTRRIGHADIEEVGGKVFEEANERARLEKENAVKRAITETQANADKRLKEELEKAHRSAEDEKRKALEESRRNAEETALRVKKARDQLERERLSKLSWKLTKEKEDALKAQWEECVRLKKEAVVKAIAETTRRLKNEFALEKELALAKALKIARENFKRKLEETIKKTIEECERKAAEEAERVARLHKSEVDRLEGIIEDIQRVNRDEVAARELVQIEFRDIQRDYKRFLDYTDGKYHSDYMMRLRKHGMKYDHNWDRRDSEEIDLYLLPSFINYHTKHGNITSHDVTKQMNFAPVTR
ncbi:hypothetical protein BSL78_00068 [Apostichopus japonicus]|uniref:Uncharacterized protein n=1 Tax=Stichopus japonicus TaxID=307972 RepID=A0A2G8LRT7_STIJA|nr:hypothetical protein BSL78_00068 [Apostichopus japonicus]